MRVRYQYSHATLSVAFLDLATLLEVRSLSSSWACFIAEPFAWPASEAAGAAPPEAAGNTEAVAAELRLEATHQ